MKKFKSILVLIALLISTILGNGIYASSGSGRDGGGVRVDNSGPGNARDAVTTPATPVVDNSGPGNANDVVTPPAAVDNSGPGNAGDVGRDDDDDIDEPDDRDDLLDVTFKTTLAIPLFGAGVTLQVEKAGIFSVEVKGAEVEAKVNSVTGSGIMVSSAAISGAQQVPAVVTAGMGAGLFIVDTVENMVHFVIRTEDLSTAEVAAHIHGPAAVGVNAGVLFGLPTGSFKVGSWHYDQALENDILTGKTYVNVHTTTFPDGEIRGQIMPVIPE